jgi:hypothetical protein
MTSKGSTSEELISRLRAWNCLGCGLDNDECRYHKALHEAEYWRSRYENLASADIGQLQSDRDYWQNEAIRLTNEINGAI